MEDRGVAIGATRAGKTAAMNQMLADYATKHPLGRARRVNDALVFLEPGPDVIPGEVISRAREVEADDGDDC